MKEELLKKYAYLTARTGGNVQPGQPVIINSDVSQHHFVNLVTEACYELGASRVTVEWSDQTQKKLDYRYRTVESLSEITDWQKGKLQEMADQCPVQIHILSEDPDGLKGMDVEKLQAVTRRRYPIVKPYREKMENRYQWTIVAVPSPAWACKVFPDLPEEEAVEKLWEQILACVHVSEDQDPIEAWTRHNDNFRERCRWLNQHKFDRITYHSANGTDFSVELMPEGCWCGGGETTLQGVYFNPNMPTEEIFTTPLKGHCQGRLVSTKPLSYQGQVIDHFSITFESGKAVSWEAEKGKEVLERIITMDEGSHMLGELALVPVSSPISQSGILFYETLFDENASCHAALGQGFNDCVDGYENRSDEECKALGVNDSMVHVDFMIGTPDLTVTGWKDGTPILIFQNGEWAF